MASPATDDLRAQLEALPARELRQRCRDAGLDDRACLERRDWVELLLPVVQAAGGLSPSSAAEDASASATVAADDAELASSDGDAADPGAEGGGGAGDGGDEDEAAFDAALDDVEADYDEEDEADYADEDAYAAGGLGRLQALAAILGELEGAAADGRMEELEADGAFRERLLNILGLHDAADELPDGLRALLAHEGVQRAVAQALHAMIAGGADIAGGGIGLGLGDGEEGEDDDELDDEAEEDDDDDSDPDAASSRGVGGDEEDPTRGQFGCKHYRRRCKLVAPCCGEVFWCRLCHNEEKNDAEPDFKKKHEMDRHAVKRVVCAACNTEQDAATECSECGMSFGFYSCLICNLFDDKDRQQFHCDGCGICRVGGRENFFHCDTCGSCYARALEGSHECVERSMHQNCPVCLEFLFDSRLPTQVLKCGHTIHARCLRGLLGTTYKCPLCNCSMVDMSRTWARMDVEVAATPMPEEYADMQVLSLCNDCHEETAAPFHVVGQKCQACGSYNTARR